MTHTTSATKLLAWVACLKPQCQPDELEDAVCLKGLWYLWPHRRACIVWMRMLHCS